MRRGVRKVEGRVKRKQSKERRGTLKLQRFLLPPNQNTERKRERNRERRGVGNCYSYQQLNSRLQSTEP